MSEFEILPPADAILRQIAPALLQVLDPGDILIGGGTALTARWQHRQSADIDLTVPATAIGREGDRIQALLKAASVTNIRHGRGWLNGMCADGEFSMSTTTPLLPALTELADRESCFGLGLEPTAEILARKLKLRMYGNGEFVSRDFYDICTAGERDRDGLELALSDISVEMRAEIAREIASLGPQAARLGRPLTGVHRPSWLGNLGERAAELIVPPHPVPRHRRDGRSMPGDDGRRTPDTEDPS